MQPIRHVGYIGLGIMGSAMAANLLKAGFQVTVWNRTTAKAAPLVQLGAALAQSPADLASRGPDAICINVSDTPDVESVIFHENGLVHGARPGLIVIDHSTISPVATQRFASILQTRNVTFLDAPVSGGDVGARSATLCIMVGGAALAYERCLPVFHAMGKTIVHLGAAGMGQVCKACNQIAVVTNLMGVCEAMALAKRSGLDVTKMIEVLGGGAAASWQLANLGPRIARGDFNPGFMIDLVLKDLAMIADTARQQNVPLPATSLAEQWFRAARALPGQHGGRLGTQAMAKVIAQLAGLAFDAAKPEEQIV
jgi:3-hydroxyisobutyrate dehydrogenase